jgi:hypothetical protein
MVHCILLKSNIVTFHRDEPKVHPRFLFPRSSSCVQFFLSFGSESDNSRSSQIVSKIVNPIDYNDGS